MVNLNNSKSALIERDIYQEKLNERVNRQRQVANVMFESSSNLAKAGTLGHKHEQSTK